MIPVCLQFNYFTTNKMNWKFSIIRDALLASGGTSCPCSVLSNNYISHAINGDKPHIKNTHS